MRNLEHLQPEQPKFTHKVTFPALKIGNANNLFGISEDSAVGPGAKMASILQALVKKSGKLTVCFSDLQNLPNVTLDLKRKFGREPTNTEVLAEANRRVLTTLLAHRLTLASLLTRRTHNYLYTRYTAPTSDLPARMKLEEATKAWLALFVTDPYELKAALAEEGETVEYASLSSSDNSSSSSSPEGSPTSRTRRPHSPVGEVSAGSPPSEDSEALSAEMSSPRTLPTPSDYPNLSKHLNRIPLEWCPIQHSTKPAESDEGYDKHYLVKIRAYIDENIKNDAEVETLIVQFRDSFNQAARARKHDKFNTPVSLLLFRDIQESVMNHYYADLFTYLDEHRKDGTVKQSIPYTELLEFLSANKKDIKIFGKRQGERKAYNAWNTGTEGYRTDGLTLVKKLIIDYKFPEEKTPQLIQYRLDLINHLKAVSEDASIDFPSPIQSTYCKLACPADEAETTATESLLKSAIAVARRRYESEFDEQEMAVLIDVCRAYAQASLAKRTYQPITEDTLSIEARDILFSCVDYICREYTTLAKSAEIYFFEHHVHAAEAADADQFIRYLLGQKSHLFRYVEPTVLSKKVSTKAANKPPTKKRSKAQKGEAQPAVKPESKNKQEVPQERFPREESKLPADQPPHQTDEKPCKFSSQGKLFPTQIEGLNKRLSFALLFLKTSQTMNSLIYDHNPATPEDAVPEQFQQLSQLLTIYEECFWQCLILYHHSGTEWKSVIDFLFAELSKEATEERQITAEVAGGASKSDESQQQCLIKQLIDDFSQILITAYSLILQPKVRNESSSEQSPTPPQMLAQAILVMGVRSQFVGLQKLVSPETLVYCKEKICELIVKLESELKSQSSLGSNPLPNRSAANISSFFAHRKQQKMPPENHFDASRSGEELIANGGPGK